MSRVSSRQIALVRAFNRFYVRRMGLLNRNSDRGEYSLTELRVLFELARRPAVTAVELRRELGLDAGYLSRILKRFRARGLVSSERSETDGRQTLLTLTEAGRRVYEPLEKAADDEVAALLDPLSPEQRKRLTASMGEIERLMK